MDLIRVVYCIMKWHVTVVAGWRRPKTTTHEFDISAKEPGQAFIPLMRKLDALGITNDNVVKITMELKND